MPFPLGEHDNKKIVFLCCRNTWQAQHNFCCNYFNHNSFSFKMSFIKIPGREAKEMIALPWFHGHNDNKKKQSCLLSCCPRSQGKHTTFVIACVFLTTFCSHKCSLSSKMQFIKITSTA
jgi:hypothetical protein